MEEIKVVWKENSWPSRAIAEVQEQVNALLRSGEGWRVLASQMTAVTIPAWDESPPDVTYLYTVTLVR